MEDYFYKLSKDGEDNKIVTLFKQLSLKNKSSDTPDEEFEPMRNCSESTGPNSRKLLFNLKVVLHHNILK